MKLSKNMAVQENDRFACEAGRIHYSAERRIAAAAVDGTSQFALAAPGGMMYIPSNDSDAVVMNTESGRMCIGVKIPDNTYALKPGELLLYSEGGAMIELRNDGKVIINGREF
ncbi:MAG: hypothetical protein II711_04265 [Clostridia bacterium]|nr:hypothetical protein [Clostridia bacterium]